MNIKDMIAKMDAIDAPSKKQELTESASMNISMTADDAGQVGQLMAMMRNAGMDAKPVDAMHSLNPRADIEKFRATVDGANDDPGIPGQDNVPGDQDLQAGVLGTLAGGAAGAAGADALDTATGGVASTATGAMGAKAGAALGSLAGPAGAAIGGALGGIAGKMAPKVAGAAIGGALGDKVTGEGFGAVSDQEAIDSWYDEVVGAITNRNITFPIAELKIEKIVDVVADDWGDQGPGSDVVLSIINRENDQTTQDAKQNEAMGSEYHCKDCGDTPHNPTTNCSHDVHDENGDHWVDNNGNGIHDADEGIIDPQTAYAEKLDSIISQAKHEQSPAGKVKHK